MVEQLVRRLRLGCVRLHCGTPSTNRGGLLDRFRLATLDHPARYPADRLVWPHLDEHSSGHGHGTLKG